MRYLFIFYPGAAENNPFRLLYGFPRHATILSGLIEENNKFEQEAMKLYWDRVIGEDELNTLYHICVVKILSVQVML